ncbi:MAG: DoxX family membrane protein [Candidatus Nealsonbacteria bacterium]|nr:DoxX family membrane protein [Candidatus Nealsonbacteria bacterium]
MNTELILLIGRIIFGGYFVYMGFGHFMKNQMLSGYAVSKGVPAARLIVYVSGLFLLFGGLGIILGVYIKVATTLLAVFLIAVSFKMHNFWAVSDPMIKMAEQVNFLKNMALLGAVLMTLAIPVPWVFRLF